MMLEQLEEAFGDRARAAFRAGTHTYRDALQEVCRDLLARGWLPRRLVISSVTVLRAHARSVPQTLAALLRLPMTGPMSTTTTGPA